MTEPEHTRAGASALGVALQLDLEVDGLRRQMTTLAQTLQALSERRDRFRVGSAAERHVVQVLVELAETGWSLLADRRWPGTRRANIDVVLAGPGGVFVIDVKRWADVRIEQGRILRGDVAADAAVDHLAAQAAAVQALLADEGLPPGEVLPLLVFDRADVAPTRVGPVHVLGERHLIRFLLRRGARLAAGQVEQLTEALDRGCPAMPGPQAPNEAVRTAAPAPSPATQGELFDTDEFWQALYEAAAAEPVETWMTWLHPSQARLVTRSWTGPARIRGAAGTGKTVVALHRARQQALAGRSVLFTSSVGTVGRVFSRLFGRLAPDLTDRVQFASVHQVAVRLLRAAGRTVTVADETALEDCFARAWSAVRRGSPLAELGVPPRYWREEISHVIKGRGITDPAAYAQLRRVRRRTALQPSQRAAMWELYTEYERHRLDRGLTDWDDVLTAALQLVDRGDVDSPWDAVIVDEVQDVSCTGLRLLHALARDSRDGLLLVGDGQQSIFPGGYSLAEAGISVVGRSTVLDVNYRNSEAVWRQALALVGADPFDDLDVAPEDGARVVRAVRRGGVVVRAEADDPASQRQALLNHLDRLRTEGVRPGDVAVLVATNDAARRWRDVIAGAGVPAMLLADYDGVRCDDVKVGTYDRAKALEFAHVLLPDADAVPGPRHPYESDDAYAERATLERSRLYVGHTRARDGLWIGTSTARHPPTP